MKKSPNQIRRLFTLCFLILLFGSANSFAQELTGKITDSSNQPIPGATIMLQGNAEVGTITDMDGVYILQLPDADNDVIVVSFIGMESQTIPVAGKSTIDVEMKDSYTSLDEVVAIGYGTVKKRDLTGAVSSIKTEELKENPVANVGQALQGKLAGVSVASQDGRPGADVNITIRGGGSITQSNNPLIILDGVPISSLNDVPADQIETIDVLKDASSTAIYGARGANGVILVTTKGYPDKDFAVTYSGFYQFKQVANRLEPLSAQEYVYRNWAYATAYGGNYGPDQAEYFGLGSANGNHYNDYTNVEAHDWTDDLLRDAAMKDHNLSIAGGTDKTKLIFNANYVDDEGIKIRSDYSRLNFQLKAETQLLDNLKVGFQARYFETETRGTDGTTNGKGSILSSAYMFRPIDNPLGTGDENGFGAFGQGDVNIDPTYNPLAQIENVENFSFRQNMTGIAFLEWEIIKGLTARTDLNASRNYSEGQYYTNGLADDKFARLTLGRGQSYRWATTLNYEIQNLGDHEVSVLVGNEMLGSNSTSSRMEGAGYADNFDFERAIGQIGATDPSLGRDKFSNSIGVPSKSLSYFGRANYSYKGRYLLTATLRADGSSKFAPNNQWGYFPAAAFGWRLSDEPFMEGTSDWLDNLKLRLSYGTAGNDGISSNEWRETWVQETITVDGLPVSTYVPEGLLSNYDLKWETTVSRNVGVDFNIFNGLFNTTVEAYWNNTEDLLGRVPVDPTSGYSYQYQNIGSTSNKGFEVFASANILRKNNFKLSVNATYNYNKSSVDELKKGVIAQYGTNWNSTLTWPKYDYIYAEGIPVGTIQGYQVEGKGYYTPDDFNYDSNTGQYTIKDGVPYYSGITPITGNYPSPFNDVVRIDEEGNEVPINQVFPGALKIKDTSGDGVIDEDDIVPLGESAPRHTGGFGVTMGFKGIDFSANFAYALGHKVFNANALANMIGSKDNSLGASRLAFVSDAYKVYDVNTDGDLVSVTDPAGLNSLNANAKYHLPYYENGVTFSTFIEDASYLRLNNLTIGYTLPKKITQKVAIERLRVYFTGGNLFVLTNYSGLDPEVNTDPDRQSSDANPGAFPTTGLDWGTYPRARTFTFGVNVAF